MIEVGALHRHDKVAVTSSSEEFFFLKIRWNESNVDLSEWGYNINPVG